MSEYPQTQPELKQQTLQRFQEVIEFGAGYEKGQADYQSNVYETINSLYQFIARTKGNAIAPQLEVRIYDLVNLATSDHIEYDVLALNRRKGQQMVALHSERRRLDSLDYFELFGPQTPKPRPRKSPALMLSKLAQLRERLQELEQAAHPNQLVYRLPAIHPEIARSYGNDLMQWIIERHGLPVSWDDDYAHDSIANAFINMAYWAHQDIDTHRIEEIEFYFHPLSPLDLLRQADGQYHGSATELIYYPDSALWLINNPVLIYDPDELEPCFDEQTADYITIEVNTKQRPATAAEVSSFLGKLLAFTR